MTEPVPWCSSRIRTLKLVSSTSAISGWRSVIAARRARSSALHRPVALGGADVALLADPDLDRGLGLDPAVGALLGDDPEALEPEERLVAAGLAAQQQLEGGVGGLVVVAEVLAPLDLLDRAQRACVGQLDSRARRARDDRPSPAELGDQDLAAVADGLRLHVLEGPGVGLDRGHVHPPLVREGVAAHVGLVGVRGQVADLVDQVGGVGQPGEAIGARRTSSRA